MKKFFKIFVVLMFLTSVFTLTSCSSDSNEVNDEQNTEGEIILKDTIVFGVTPWTSTIPPTHVAKLIIEDMGYNVELQDADAGVVYAGLSKGDLDVYMDSWLPDLHANYMAEYGENIDDIAVSYPDGETGWIVPAYMENINTVEDLIGNEEIFDGKVYGIDQGAGMTASSLEMIEELDLDLEYIASSEAAMLSQATKDIASENPIIFLGWRPHSMFAMWDLKIIPNSAGYFSTSEVHVLTSKESNLSSSAPDVYAFLSNWSIPVGDVEQMILAIDNGAEPDDVAREWINNNQDKVNVMLGK